MMLSKMTDLSSLGIYMAALGLLYKMAIIPTGLAGALYPALASSFKKSREDAGDIYRKFFLYVLLICLPLAVGVFFVAEDIILLIYGRQYSESAAILKVGIWIFPLWGVIFLQFNTLAANYNQKYVVYAYAISTISNVLLNFFLISFAGIKGAVWATLISHVIHCSALSYFTHKHAAKCGLLNVKVINTVSANILLAMVLFFLPSGYLVVTIILGAFTYLVLLFALKIIRLNEISLLKDRLSPSQ
jgi:O-antigen/teichoic acid export membrane protein